MNMKRLDVGRRSPPLGSLLVLCFVCAACVSYPLDEPVVSEPAPAPPDAGNPIDPPPPDPVVSEPAPPPPEPPPRLLPGANLFGDDQVLEIRLTLSPSDQLALEQHGDDEIYVPAEASVVGSHLAQVELGTIGVRHKGAYSLHHCWDDFGVRSYSGACARLSYKLKFDKYAPETRLDGVKRLNLHASSGDASRLRELTAYSLFRDFGVEAPRTAVARLIVNGNLEGLFIVVEAMDGRFTKAHFPDGGGDGNLYKELWPSPELEPADMIEALRTNEDVADVSGFSAFSAAVGATTHASFAADMASWVDLDHTLRYIAVDRALKNWDGIMAFYSPISPHNFYWYHDVGGSGRFQLVPWDMDNSLWAFDPYMAPQAWVSASPVPDWNEEPLACEPRSVWDASGETSITPPRCDLFLDTLAETHFERFQVIATELLAGPLEPARWIAKVSHYGDLLEPIISEDPLLNVDAWRTQRENFKLLLERAGDDFRAFAAAGLQTEAP